MNESSTAVSSMATASWNCCVGRASADRTPAGIRRLHGLPRRFRVMITTQEGLQILYSLGDPNGSWQDDDDGRSSHRTLCRRSFKSAVTQELLQLVDSRGGCSGRRQDDRGCNPHRLFSRLNSRECCCLRRRSRNCGDLDLRHRSDIDRWSRRRRPYIDRGAVNQVPSRRRERLLYEAGAFSNWLLGSRWSTAEWKWQLW